jgi:hypothetical protein
MDESLARIQSGLAKEVREQLDAPETADYARLSSALECLLTWHWHSRGLSRSIWFDGVDEPTIRPHRPDRLEILGFMVWADDGKKQWSEIFSADIRLARGATALSGYTLRFGRKGFEDRKILYGKYAKLRTEMNDIDRLEWAFVFRMEEWR